MTRRGRLVRSAFGVVVWGGLVTAVVAAWDDVSGPIGQAGAMLPVAVLAIMVGLLAASAGWAALLSEHLRASSMRAFLAAQAAKYLPFGGIAQAAGQIGLTSDRADDRTNVAVSFFVHAGVQVYAAVLVAILVVFERAVSLLEGCAIVAVVTIGATAMRESALNRILGSLRRLVPRIPDGRSPSTASLWKSCLLTTVPLMLSGGAFAGLAGLWSDPAHGLAGVGAFAGAWAVGFVAVPVPSGLGVREAVLVGLLPGMPATQVIGVSLVHRFATLLAELTLLGTVSRRTFVDIDPRK